MPGLQVAGRRALTMAGRLGRMPTYALARAIGEPAVSGIRSGDS